MRFGLQINPHFAGTTGNAWDSVERAVRYLDGSAFDSVWLYDHVLYEGGYPGHPDPEPVLECFTALGAVAAITRRIRLGQLVVGTPYRNPALLGKMATTLDAISHGRSILGIGAAWHQREYEAYGWGVFEDVPTRMKRLEEALQVILALWTQRPASFQGAYYRLDAVQENPHPVQRPHPPILIGGNGEKVTLRLVARYGDLCNVSGDSASVERLFAALRAHCAAVGRPYEAITRTIYTTVIVGRDAAEVAAKRARLAPFIPRDGALFGTPEELIEAFRAYARVGAQYAIFRTPEWIEVEPLRLFAEQVIPALADA